MKLYATLLFSLFAFHQSWAGEPSPTGLDCSATPNPKACEMFKTAEQACADKQGDEFKLCVRNKLMPPKPAGKK